jgi:zinc D-Ala-D-Ala carboxypeptidase
MNIEANHWRDVIGWRWPHFKPQELACRGEPGKNSIKVSVELLDKLEALRSAIGRPLQINSGYRSPGYNSTLEGAASKSEHVQGRAVDISMTGHDPAEFYDAARSVGFRGFGFYPEPRNNFMHLDIGAARTWGNPKPWGIDPRKAKPLYKSKTLAGSAMSSVGLAGGAVQEAGYMLQSLSDYAEIIKIVCIVLTLAGIALTVWARISESRRDR